MKKYILFCAGIGLAMAFTSCGSSEKAYRKAYEKAQAQAAQQQMQATETQQTETPVVTPVVTKPATQTQVTDNYDNVSVRQERVVMVNGAGLKNYSVVVGSFGLQTNAEGLQQQLRDGGYLILKLFLDISQEEQHERGEDSFHIIRDVLINSLEWLKHCRGRCYRMGCKACPEPRRF